MTLAIVGSRTFNDYDLLKHFIIKHFDLSSIDKIVSGGARGADVLGARFATENKIEILEFPADWKRYGRRAGFIRNVDIIKNCDQCAIFWDGKSHGTKHDVDLCEQMNKPYKICRFDLIELIKQKKNGEE